MARTLTNDFSLHMAIQQAFGTLGASPAWKQLEPNSVATFGPQITTVARDPISPNRQRRKGTITDLDSSVEFETDLTYDSITDFVQPFVFASATNTRVQSGALYQNLLADTTLPILTTEGFAFDALAAAIPVGQLVYTRGFTTDANNALWEVTASNTTEVEVDGGAATGVVDETPGNTDNASLETAGFRFTDLTWDDTAKTLGSALVDLTTIGLTVGQVIYIGGLTGSERFTNGTAYARVTAIVAATVTVDKLTNVLGTGLDGGGNEGASAVDLLFGRFIRNVSRSDASFLEQYLQFEGGYPGLFDTDPPSLPQPDGFEYALDNLLGGFTWNMPGQDKSTLTLALTGTDTEAPVDNASRKTNASTPAIPVGTEAYNTVSDFARFRFQDTDGTLLTNDVTDMTATFSNNVSPEKVLAFLGAKFLNFGNFDVNLEMTAVFASQLPPARIRANTTITGDWILRNDDGAICVDIPSLTLGNGAKDLPVDESIKIGLTGTAFQDATLGTSIGVSTIPTVPSS